MPENRLEDENLLVTLNFIIFYSVYYLNSLILHVLLHQDSYNSATLNYRCSVPYCSKALIQWTLLHCALQYNAHLFFSLI